jgi:16S rRNA (cytosine967-C5)-methyltransferase
MSDTPDKTIKSAPRPSRGRGDAPKGAPYAKPAAKGQSAGRGYGPKRPGTPARQGGPARRPSGPARPSAPARPSGPDARRIALDALIDVTAAGAFSTLALDDRLRKSRIDPADKRLATSIFYTALENRLKLDYALSQFVQRMPDRQIAAILHIAAAQLLLMDKIPDYAAVDAAANQARALDREQYVALVNGTLRALARARDADSIRWPDASDPIKRLSIMHSLPEALAARLIDDYGFEAAERIIAYRPERRVETLRPNLTKMDAAAFEAYGEKRGWALERATLTNAYHLFRAGDLAGDPDFKAGLFSVQGEGSMLAAYALEPVRAGHYLDACAAPGGKSALIGEIMQNTGRVHCWDVHDHRVALIQAVKKRLRLDNLRPAQRDASLPRAELAFAFDGVLIDAPCSGLGVIHDKPDIKYRLEEADIDSLCALQRRILDACAPYVAAGGLLVYATCTITKDENEEQVRAFLSRHPEFEPEPCAQFLPEALRPLYSGGMIQLQAHDWNAEGFFIARMRRRRA